MGLTRPNIKSCAVTSYNLFKKRAKKTKWIYTKYYTIPLKSHTAQRVSCLGTRCALRMLSNSFCLILGLFVVYIFICMLFLLPPVCIRVWLFVIQPDWRCLGIYFFFISACPKSAFESLYLQFMMLK